MAAGGCSRQMSPLHSTLFACAVESVACTTAPLGRRPREADEHTGLAAGIGLLVDEGDSCENVI